MPSQAELDAQNKASKATQRENRDRRSEERLLKKAARDYEKNYKETLASATSSGERRDIKASYAPPRTEIEKEMDRETKPHEGISEAFFKDEIVNEQQGGTIELTVCDDATGVASTITVRTA